MEDWAGAAAHMLRGGPGMVIDNPKIPPGEKLMEVPESVKNFYDRILLNPGQSSLISHTVRQRK